MCAKVENVLLNKIFESVRKENAIIWAGAGVSIQAGFPSGQKLAETFLNSISESQTSYFENKSSLMEITEEFVQINDKESAINVIKSEFNKIGGESVFHSTLSKIPHFKTLVTTNYDCLFEREYGDLITTPIIDPNDIKRGLEGRVQLFKVHGDLSSEENMILTKSDYDNFFLFNRSDQSNWSLVKERLVTKDVIFVGYGFDDSNISILYRKIKNELQNKSQRAFLIAPGLPEHRISNLKDKGIDYFDMTGEEFAVKLIENLKENIVADFESNWVSPETYREFCVNHNLLPTIEANDNGYSLKKMSTASEQADGLFKVQINKNSDKIEALRKFVSGDSNEDVRISSEELKYFAMLMEGIKVHEIQQGEGEITLQKNPTRTETIDVIFDDDFEHSDIPIIIFGSEKLIEIRMEIHTLNITIKLNPKFLGNASVNLKVLFSHQEVCKSTNEELKVVEIVKRLSSGMSFDIHWKDLAFTKTLKNTDLGNSNKKHSLFIEYIRNIERNFKVRFKNFPMYPSEDELFVINVLNEIIQFGEVTIRGKYEISGQFDFNTDSSEVLEKLQTPFTEITIKKSYQENLELFGKSFVINISRTDLLDAKVVNIDELKDKKTKIVKLMATSKKITTN